MDLEKEFNNLEKKIGKIDFKNIKGIGQGFADEVFRVFALEHPEVGIIPVNACPAVLFMIDRAKSRGLQ